MIGSASRLSYEAVRRLGVMMESWICGFASPGVNQGAVVAKRQVGMGGSYGRGAAQGRTEDSRRVGLLLLYAPTLVRCVDGAKDPRLPAS